MFRYFSMAILAALLVGGRVQIFDDETTHDPARLLDQIEQREVTILEIVPSMMRIWWPQPHSGSEAGSGHAPLDDSDR